MVWIKLTEKKEKTYLYVPLSKIKFILNENFRVDHYMWGGDGGDG